MAPAAPTVSVVITTYNHAPFVRQAIESVLAQSFVDREVVVVDDGSTDGTADLLRQFGDAIRLVVQPNAGVAAARNRGVAEATGDLIALLDGDDYWHPSKLQRQVEAWAKRPETGLVAVDGVQFSTEGTRLPHLLSNRALGYFEEGQAEATQSCYDDLLDENLIFTTSQVMIPREVLTSVGGSDGAFAIASDYDLYLRIAERWPVTFVREPLTYWRYLATSASGAGIYRRFRCDYDILLVLQKHLNSAHDMQRARLSEAIDRRVRETAWCAFQFGRAGDESWARSYLASLWRFRRQPHIPLRVLLLATPRFLRERCLSALVGKAQPVS